MTFSLARLIAIALVFLAAGNGFGRVRADYPPGAYGHRPNSATASAHTNGHGHASASASTDSHSHAPHYGPVYPTHGHTPFAPYHGHHVDEEYGHHYDAHGHSGHHLGHSDHHVGHSGHHLGHSGHHLGHSDHYVGHSGHHLGHSDHLVGHGSPGGYGHRETGYGHSGHHDVAGHQHRGLSGTDNGPYYDEYDQYQRQGSSRSSSLSKVPVVGRFFYNPSQADLHRSYKGEKAVLSHLAKGYGRAVKAAPKIKTGYLGRRVPLATDEMHARSQDIASTHNNVQQYKNMIRNGGR